MEAEARGAGHASRPFYLVNPQGRVFGFRALVKDPVLDWPEEQQTETLRHLGIEQQAGTIPGGALVVAEITRAVGVRSLDVRLVALPDDARLGQWQKDYGGKVGVLETRLRPLTDESADPGPIEYVDTDSLFVLLRSDPKSVVDARAFLASRLVDILVGDWDRHAGQWTWMSHVRGSQQWWIPISNDRDWAFTNLDGFVWSLFRKAQPKFQVFDGGIRHLPSLMLMSRPLDRRLLAPLDRATWDSVTRSVVEHLPDRVLARAVGALPPGMDSSGLTRLESTLRERRDHLSQASAEFYRRLADVVEVWGTESADHVEVAEGQHGAVVLRLARGGRSDGWSRTFDPEETHEVRVYLLGGNDRVTGDWHGGPITVRIIHEGHGNLTVDSTVNGVEVNDSKSASALPGKQFDPQKMFRDWGTKFGLSPWVGQKAGAGIILGGGPVFTKYGFHREPYAYTVTARAAYGTTGSTVNFQTKGDFRFARPGAGVRFDAKALQADAVHYFGFGNETTRSEISDFYLLLQHTYQVTTTLYGEFGKHAVASVGPVFSRTVSSEARPSLALDQQPYGFGSFTELGAMGDILIDLRDDPVYPVRGVKAEVNGRVFPAIGDVGAAFGVVRGELAGYLGTRSLPGTPVVAVRVGGARGFGEVPFFESPSLGGKPSLRGFSRERFTGDGALYGGAELRFNLGRFKMVVPGEIGVYGLGDIGRVYVAGESSTLWHKSYGAGLWVTLFDRSLTGTFTWGHSLEGQKIFLAAGFHF